MPAKPKPHTNEDTTINFTMLQHGVCNISGCVMDNTESEIDPAGLSKTISKINGIKWKIDKQNTIFEKHIFIMKSEASGLISFIVKFAKKKKITWAI